MKTHLRFLTILSLLLLGVLLPLTASPAPAKGKKPHRPFLIGAAWDSNAPPAAKALFYETGCNFVRLSGGGFGWSLDEHRKALAELRGHGISVMLQLGSHWPDGSYTQHKEDFLVDDRGETGTLDPKSYVVSYSGSPWPQYTYASPEFRAHLEKDFGNYLGALGSDPMVVELLLHNEPGYHWVKDRVFDYNPQAIAAFREWLPSQYSDLAALNASWGTHYSAFTEVEPAKQRPPVANIAAWMDWRRFNIDLIAKFLTWEETYAHRLCPTLPSTTNLSGPLDNWFPLRLGDNYRYTAPFDTAGIDIYSSEWTNRFFVGYAMDTTRGAAGDRPVTVAECDSYDPSPYPKLSDTELADRLRSDLWGYIGHGASAISIWTLSGQGGFKLTSGEYNARIGAVREIAHLSKMLDLGDFTSPRRSVALVVDQDAFLYYGGLGSSLDGGSWCQRSLQGMYAALAAAGYKVDIISADQVRGGVDGRYRALVMATPAITDVRLAGSLESFMNRGGVVVAEAPFAQFDRWGKAVAPQDNGLQKLFGVETVKPYNDGEESSIPSLGFEGQGRTGIRLAGAAALAAFADGSPAVTQKSQGLGKAILIASDVGVADADGGQPGLSRFLSSALGRSAGVEPGVKAVADGYLDASVLQDGRGNRLIVVTDPSDKLEAPIERKNVDVVVRGPHPAAGSQLFVIKPSYTNAGRTFAGPRLGALPTSSGGATHLRLPSIDSAAVFLVARDHDPLLSIDAPSSAKVGSTVQVNVTCYNPSPGTISGRLTLDLPDGWRLAGPAESVKISARGQKAVVFTVRIGDATGRSVVKAAFEQGSGTAPVASVPVDVMVTR